jgi:hypothetical protein
MKIFKIFPRLLPSTALLLLRDITADADAMCSSVAVSVALRWLSLLINLFWLSADMPHYYHVCTVSTENEFKALMFHPQYTSGQFLTTTAKLQF